MKGMFRSKRFVAFIIAIALFLLLIYTTEYGLMEISGSISILVSIYITNQSLRSSKKDNETNV